MIDFYFICDKFSNCKNEFTPIDNWTITIVLREINHQEYKIAILINTEIPILESKIQINNIRGISKCRNPGILGLRQTRIFPVYSTLRVSWETLK